MATYTPNYHLSKPESTDPMTSFMEDYAANMDAIDSNLGGGGGGGNLSAVETTSIAYAALTEQQKKDTTKIYFLNDNESSDVETPVDPVTYYNLKESSMNIQVSNGKLVYTWLGGASIGANSFESVAIPREAKALKIKLTTGNSYSTTTERFKICVGVKAAYQQSSWVTPEDADWLAKVIYNTQNATAELTLDLTEINVDSYLMIAGHGWTVTFDEIAVVTDSEITGNTGIRYKDVPYGTGGVEYYLSDGLIGSSGGTYVTCDLMKPLVKGLYLICITDSTSIGFTHMKWTGVSQTLNVDVPTGGQLRITHTSAGLTYYSGSGRDIKCDIVKLVSAYVDEPTPLHLVEYLQSTGTQFINLGVGANATNIHIEAAIEFQTTSNDGFAWGGFNNGHYGFADIYNDRMYNKLKFFYGSNQSLTVNAPAYSADTKYTIDVTASGSSISYVINGEQQIVSVSNATATGDIYLFRRGTDSNYMGRVKIYYFRLYVDGALVRDMVPVIDENDVPCMYDQVSSGYFYNLGTGSFTAGPDV